MNWPLFNQKISSEIERHFQKPEFQNNKCDPAMPVETNGVLYNKRYDIIREAL